MYIIFVNIKMKFVECYCKVDAFLYIFIFMTGRIVNSYKNGIKHNPNLTLKTFRSPHFHPFQTISLNIFDANLFAFNVFSRLRFSRLSSYSVAEVGPNLAAEAILFTFVVFSWIDKVKVDMGNTSCCYKEGQANHNCV